MAVAVTMEKRYHYGTKCAVAGFTPSLLSRGGRFTTGPGKAGGSGVVSQFNGEDKKVCTPERVRVGENAGQPKSSSSLPLHAGQ